MKMKMNAKGDASVPSESRHYLRVYMPLKDDVSADYPMFFHKVMW
jgi:hypothetical protein